MTVDIKTGEILEDSEGNLVRVVDTDVNAFAALTLTGEHAGKMGWLGNSNFENFSRVDRDSREVMEEVYSQLYGSYYPEGKWINVGDANPRKHGGIFVKWKEEFVHGSIPDGYWRVITTTNAEEMGLDAMVEEGGKYMFIDYMISPDDFWEDPLAPEKGFDDRGKSALSVVGQGDTHPGNVEEIVRAAPHAAQEITDGRDSYTDNYWEKANSYGIYKESVT